MSRPGPANSARPCSSTVESTVPTGMVNIVARAEGDVHPGELEAGGGVPRRPEGVAGAQLVPRPEAAPDALLRQLGPLHVPVRPREAADRDAGAAGPRGLGVRGGRLRGGGAEGEGEAEAERHRHAPVALDSGFAAGASSAAGGFGPFPPSCCG